MKERSEKEQKMVDELAHGFSSTWKESLEQLSKKEILEQVLQPEYAVLMQDFSKEQILDILLDRAKETIKETEEKYPYLKKSTQLNLKQKIQKRPELIAAAIIIFAIWFVITYFVSTYFYVWFGKTPEGFLIGIVLSTMVFLLIFLYNWDSPKKEEENE
jgi:hypothetical protein